ncbi:MAG: TolC family protein [Sulfurospirillaceae bacterium]|nr:TolC family protein [Sulfurospirillaceae bacterium]
MSSLKQEMLRVDKEKNKLESDALQYDWVKQIIGAYSTTKTDQIGTTQGIDTFSIVLEQPIFRSGGIYYAIKYANANRAFLELKTKIDEQTLLKEIIASLIDLKKVDLLIQKQAYLIANAKIDIERKREQYEHGVLDSSFLDQALLSHNALQKAMIDLQSNRYASLMAFSNLSDSDYITLQPPLFMLMDAKQYLEASLLVAQQKSQIERSEYLKNMTIASYLPTLSVVAGYYDTNNDLYGRGSNNYKNYGLKVSMPLFDINLAKNIEIKRLEYLKAQLQAKDIERSEENFYQMQVNNVHLLEQKIVLAEADVKAYDALMLLTKDAYSAGEKTIYDVDTLTNSLRAIMLDKAIFELDIQKLLVELYARMNGEL